MEASTWPGDDPEIPSDPKMNYRTNVNMDSVNKSMNELINRGLKYAD